MIILDTHIWLEWVIQGGNGLPASIFAAIESEQRVAVSAISCFEISYLLKRQRITLPLPIQDWLRDALSPAGIEILPISCEIAFLSAELPQHHRDPADRIIIHRADWPGRPPPRTSQYRRLARHDPRGHRSRPGAGRTTALPRWQSPASLAKALRPDLPRSISTPGPGGLSAGRLSPGFIPFARRWSGAISGMWPM